MNKTLVFLIIVIFFTSCVVDINGKVTRYPKLKKQEYEVSTKYRTKSNKTDLSNNTIYGITIVKDSCVFYAKGDSINFVLDCEIKKSKNKIYLLYSRTIEGEIPIGYTNVDTVAVISNSNYRYYIKSPFVPNRKGEYDKMVSLNSKGRRWELCLYIKY